MDPNFFAAIIDKLLAYVGDLENEDITINSVVEFLWKAFGDVKEENQLAKLAFDLNDNL